MEHSKHIIVIGASAGGMPAIKQLIADIPHQADAIVACYANKIILPLASFRDVMSMQLVFA